MKKRKIGRIVFWILLVPAVLALTGVIVGMNLAERSLKTKESRTAETETETESETASEEGGMVPKPEISEQLLTVNDYSRPGVKLDKVNYIVIHYLGNPETTAQQNRDYFESLKDLQDTYMSANFIVGLDGEIIQCVPEDEEAYASNQENDDSISIENCHIDETGKLLSDTYLSLVKLTAYLVDKYDLTRDQIIRHYDVTGKECPIYYVKNEDAWETFRDDVMTYVELCQSYTVADEELKKTLQGLSDTYSDRSEKQTEEDTEPETEAPQNYDDESHEESYQDSGAAGDNSYQYQPPAYTPDTGTTTYTEAAADTQAATDYSTSDTGTADTSTSADDSTSDTSASADDSTSDTSASADDSTSDTSASADDSTSDTSASADDSTSDDSTSVDDSTSDDSTSTDSTVTDSSTTDAVTTSDDASTTSDDSAVEAPVDAPVDE